MKSGSFEFGVEICYFAIENKAGFSHSSGGIRPEREAF